MKNIQNIRNLVMLKEIIDKNIKLNEKNHLDSIGYLKIDKLIDIELKILVAEL